jgi:hypothetical protein
MRNCRLRGKLVVLREFNRRDILDLYTCEHIIED